MTWSANLRWNATNSSTVVGRYAYVIYDEGGLLDMNAAGFPPDRPPISSPTRAASPPPISPSSQE